MQGPSAFFKKKERGGGVARWLGGVVVAPFSRVVKISVHINYGRHCGNAAEAGAVRPRACACSVHVALLLRALLPGRVGTPRAETSLCHRDACPPGHAPGTRPRRTG